MADVIACRQASEQQQSQHILGASTDDEVGALQHVLQVQVPHRVSQARDAQHGSPLLALHARCHTASAVLSFCQRLHEWQRTSVAGQTGQSS